MKRSFSTTLHSLRHLAALASLCVVWMPVVACTMSPDDEARLADGALEGDGEIAESDQALSFVGSSFLTFQGGNAVPPVVSSDGATNNTMMLIPDNPYGASSVALYKTTLPLPYDVEFEYKTWDDDAGPLWSTADGVVLMLGKSLAPYAGAFFKVRAEVRSDQVRVYFKDQLVLIWVARRPERALGTCWGSWGGKRRRGGLMRRRSRALGRARSSRVPGFIARLARLGMCITIRTRRSRRIPGPRLRLVIRGLEDRYGEPTSTRSNLPNECTSTVTSCLAEGKAGFWTDGRWNSEKNISLAMGNASGNVVLRITYRRTRGEGGPAR